MPKTATPPGLKNFPIENFPIDKLPPAVFAKHPLAEVLNPVKTVTLTVGQGYDFDTHTVLPTASSIAPDLSFTFGGNIRGVFRSGTADNATIGAPFGEATQFGDVTSLDNLFAVDQDPRGFFVTTDSLLVVQLDTPAELDPVYLVDVVSLTANSVTFDYILFG